jgi:hypothetical protein
MVLIENECRNNDWLKKKYFPLLQAQTISNLYFAVDQGLTIIPIINKIDMEGAMIEETADQMIDLIGCKREDTIEVLLTLSAPTLTDAQIKVYPNPTSGKLTIELLGNFNNVSVSITDILGRKILNQHIEQRTDHNINLDLNGNANGIYVLEFTTAQGKIQKRILLRGN